MSLYADTRPDSPLDECTADRFVEVMVDTLGCLRCNGSGYTDAHDPNDPHEFGCCTSCPIQVPCEYCHGRGCISVVRSIQSDIERAGREVK